MFPRWMSWIFLLFLGYIIFTGNQASREQREIHEKPESPTTSFEEKYPKIDAFIDRDRWLKGINPDYKTQDDACRAPQTADGTLKNYAIIERESNNPPAKCGETITITAILWDQAGKKSKTISSREITLGKQPGLDALLYEMGVNDQRQLILTVPEDGYDALPELKKGTAQLITITRVENAKPQDETGSADQPSSENEAK